MNSIGRLVTFAILLTSLPATAVADIVENKSNRTIALPDTLGPGVNILAGATSADDCDDIRITSSAVGSPRPPTVTLRTSAGMWGKDAELFADGRSFAVLSAPGNGGSSASTSLVPDDLYKTQINLLKPKAFGVRTGLYQIVGLSRFANQDIVILWTRDRC